MFEQSLKCKEPRHTMLLAESIPVYIKSIAEVRCGETVRLGETGRRSESSLSPLSALFAPALTSQTGVYIVEVIDFVEGYQICNTFSSISTK
jgi:hypothetical protein